MEVRVEYRAIGKLCLHCDAPATVARIGLTLEGEVTVQALCQDHANADAAEIVTQGFEQQEEGGIFLNISAMGEAATLVREAMEEAEQEEEG